MFVFVFFILVLIAEVVRLTQQPAVRVLGENNYQKFHEFKT